MRKYVDYKQINWVSLLPLIQIAYNNSVNDTIKQIPFFANYKFYAKLFKKLKAAKVLVKAASIAVTNIKTLY